jgi:ribose 5-phosphate isomerase A
MSSATPDLNAEKLDAARRSVTLVEPGMVVGLGSGSTATLVVEALGQRVRQGLVIRAISSSSETRRLAEKEGIPLIDFEQASVIDLTIDGADEVDPQGGMIKGRGGALLYEKILAVNSRRLVIAVDSSKAVARLGQRFPVPVEVIPLARPLLAAALTASGASVVLRAGQGGAPYLTDEGNQILDCGFGPLADAAALADRLDRMVGVVEHGLFLGLAPTVIVGRTS